MPAPNDEILRRLSAGDPSPKNPIRTRWSLVCLGYQPELAAAWSACTRAFGEEAKQGRVFEESLFWIVTRTIHGFHGMGHCEMRLAVAGLDQNALEERTRLLAGPRCPAGTAARL